MTISNFNYDVSYLPGVICNIVVNADLHRPPGTSIPCNWCLVVKNGNFTLLLTSFSQEMAHLTHCYWHLVVKNGNFTLLLTSGGQEWQFHIATDILWSRMAISHCYWHLVVKTANWQICQQIYPSKCIMGYILRDVFGSHFGFFKKKVGIFFYFWIIRVVICQLALYIHIRYKPPWHPWNNSLMTSTDPYRWMAISHCYWHLVVNLICQYGNVFQRLTSSGQDLAILPTLLLMSSGQEWQFHIATDI